MTDTPRIPYWHVYVDRDGVSRQAQFDIRDFELKGVSPGVTPQWNDKMTPSPAGVTFTVLPVGWVGEWHENPKPQWITILTGRWFVETMDGTRVEMGPGEVMTGRWARTRARRTRRAIAPAPWATSPAP